MTPGSGSKAIAIARPQRLRLIADDLTGALDTAAQFATVDAALPVIWHDIDTIGSAAPLAFDTGCREQASAEARAVFARAVDVLAPQTDCISLLKLDSLLRGHAADEIAACAARWPDRPIIVAPAFPKQRRVTRGGRQFVLQPDGARLVGEDIGAALRTMGRPITHFAPGASPPGGIALCDAETDRDLMQIVDAASRLLQTPIWCGSAGLGATLAARIEQPQRRPAPPLARPLLGIFGTDHAVTRQQLAMVENEVIAVSADNEPEFAVYGRTLDTTGVCLLRFTLPDTTTRATARGIIAQRIAATLKLIPRPQTLVVSGGETLRSVCDALGATGLLVDGEVAPGIPSSIMRDGAWQGLRIISKSGAFGAPDFLSHLLGSEISPMHKEPT